tara:strand:+ start:2778 stop:3125 length:348 start_codon:yes stop_codon:yes gene_type:complete
MNIRYIIFAILFFLAGQCIVWVQVNGPLIWDWAKTFKWVLMLLGVPITYLFMEATRFGVLGFEGNFWPSRFLSFVSGILIFTVMTWMFRSEPITLKTIVSLCLAFSIIVIQLFWK